MNTRDVRAPTTAEWATIVTGPVSVSEVELRVLGLDEESFETYRAADTSHAHPVRRAGRILGFICSVIAAGGPLWAFTGIFDRSDASRYAYDVSPQVEYPTIFICLTAASISNAALLWSMLKRREGTSIAIAFWYSLVYMGALPYLTFRWVERGPDTPPTWMLYPALVCSGLGILTAALSLVFPRTMTFDEDERHHRSLLHYTRQELRRGETPLSDLEPDLDGNDYRAAAREALLRDRREALDVLVARGLLDTATADHAATLPLGEAITPPEPTAAEQEAAASHARFVMLRERRETLDVLVARGEITAGAADQEMRRMIADQPATRTEQTRTEQTRTEQTRTEQTRTDPAHGPKVRRD